MAETVFGYHAVESLLRLDPKRVKQVLVQSNRNDKRMQALRSLAANQGVTAEPCPRQTLDERVEGRHQGVVAVLHSDAADSHEGMSEAKLLSLVGQATVPLILILDGVTDPHNLGACLRSAEAAGVTAVIFPKDRSADVNAVVRKVACGAAESVPWLRVTNLARTIETLKQSGIWIVGTSGDATETLFEHDLTGPCALVLGSEGSGMRRLTQELCDYRVHLPMAGSVSSLNVSVAAGICLFEAVRQRRG
jgi:23S rRNA (guanosine2251-2'-O)-methyltransferase